MADLFAPLLPRDDREPVYWTNLAGGSRALAILGAARHSPGPVLVVTHDMHSAEQLETELHFFSATQAAPTISIFPDRETLPYDVFSPHQDIISERIAVLSGLADNRHDILIAPVASLMVRLPPREFLVGGSLRMDVGDHCDIETLRLRLEAAGYHHVSQVAEHGEYCIRGGLIDLFPMGSGTPFRIDLFDQDIESIRVFDPDSQRTTDRIDRIRLMPAREIPLTKEAISLFRQGFRSQFAGDPQRCPVYREVSQGMAPAGIEYYLPLFFPQTQTLFDYLPSETLVLIEDDLVEPATSFWQEICERYEQGRYDGERPLLPPDQVFLPAATLIERVDGFRRCIIAGVGVEPGPVHVRFETRAPGKLSLPPRAPHALAPLVDFIRAYPGRTLLVAETGGRREVLLEMLQGHDVHPVQFHHWADFVAGDARLGITVAALDRGVILEDPAIAILSESQIFGDQAMQRRRRVRKVRDTETIVQDLTELSFGAPVVHEEHGVGRYLGLQTLDSGGVRNEYLKLEYADSDILYVPVSSLHLISRYTGAAPEQAPLHKLGSGQWQRARRKAAERVRDVAVELLDIYARREARKGRAFPPPDDQYAAFAAAFPFEETPDQEETIRSVLADMTANKPMDRLVCGDVGFGKTEVAMRAAFIAVQGHSQVAVLVPTTLLAQQHWQNFRDRFADLPVRVELISRFRSGKQQEQILDAVAGGQVDILIGTHKLLQGQVKFKDLGLLIIDEEHRFGVRQKERLKALRAEVDVLTLTATPIPRTLNMALSEIRDLSIIATPPLRRLAIKTFVRQWGSPLIREACLREIRRGGQIYFLHNEVRTIERMGEQIREIVPEASVGIAHGQMPERELEQIMLDFYHQRFNLLLCSTIIESGIDIPNANTIIINRADRLGLAQLYQLRGRVGRSHHQAYAYLLAPPRGAMTPDAVKRLEAIEAIADLGAGFTLAAHDLEIRGAGELLGEEQSGQIHEIGFSLYTSLLERAVHALRAGREPALDQPLAFDTEVDMGVAALIPDDYLPDVHTRLVFYKRIASARDGAELRELQVEMIDRFGLLPQAAKNLFHVTELRLEAVPLGIRKIEAGAEFARIVFGEDPRIDGERLIQLIQTRPRELRLDGKDRLRLQLAERDLEPRLAQLRSLIDQITLKDAVPA